MNISRERVLVLVPAYLPTYLPIFHFFLLPLLVVSGWVGGWKVEGGIFTCQRNKPWGKNSKHWSNGREGRQLEEEEEDDDDEGEERYF